MPRYLDGCDLFIRQEKIRNLIQGLTATVVPVEAVETSNLPLGQGGKQPTGRFTTQGRRPEPSVDLPMLFQKE
jgi:hypothetical protein